MTECPCKVDHWKHLAAGFQGIVGMMAVLDAAGVKPSKEALEKLKEQLARLQEQVARQESRSHD